MIFLWISRRGEDFTPEQKRRIAASPFLTALAWFRAVAYGISSVAFLLGITVCFVGMIGGMIWNGLTGQ